MPRRHALIIQHHPVETLGGNFAAVLREAGFGLTTLPLYAGAPDCAAAAFDAAPDLAGVDLIITLGGPMSANDDCPALRRCQLGRLARGGGGGGFGGGGRRRRGPGAIGGLG